MSNFVEIRDKDNALLGQLPVSKEGGRLRNIVYMTESGVYEKPSWLKFVRVKGVGGGGGGGGVGATTSGQYVCGGFGGAGGYFEKRILASALAASETVTIGDAGAKGEAGVNNGAAGGTTSFGSHCSATGGGGGAGMAAVVNTTSCIAMSGSGGIATGGDVNIPGKVSPRATALNMAILLGVGPSTPYGNGGAAGFGTAGAASGYGSGGAGAASVQNIAAKAGGNGAHGIVIIEEYE